MPSNDVVVGHSLLLWMCVVHFGLTVMPGPLARNSTAASMRMSTTLPGDIQIAVLFPVHRKIAGTERCGEIWEQYGIQRTEIALMTIDAINNDPSILPNVQLGISIRDDCWTERIAMEQIIEFIRDVVGGQLEKKLSQCPYQPAEDGPKVTNLAAVIGPGSSDVSIAVQNLLQVFHIPQVGYSATTKALSDKTEFKYYMRVVPSDSWQAKAMVDIVRYFNWSYVAVIYTDGNYGEKGFEELQKNFEEEENLCIGVSEKIKTLAPPQEYDRLIDYLMSYRPTLTVAICFCEGDTIKRIFEATKRVHQKAGRRSKKSLQWIGSESWSDRKDVVAGVEDLAAGAYSFRIFSPPVPQFDSYYFSLTPENNKRNAWFVDFWEEKFNCSYRESTTSFYSKRCTGFENTTIGYKPDPKLSQVVTSIYTVAYALDTMYKDLCVGNKGRGLCPAMIPVDGNQLFKYMLNAQFRDVSGEQVYFDENGDPPARYDILNYQGKKAGYVNVGNWGHIKTSRNPSRKKASAYRSKLNINRHRLLWHNGKTGSTYTPEARCSQDCGVGEIKKIQAMKCCWTCVPCFENEFLLNEYTCKQCPLGYWPTENRTECFKLDVEYMRWADVGAIVCVAIACVGATATLFTTVIFIRHNGTPVVKATTRELSYIILAGLLLCYLTTFVIVHPPCTVTCILLRMVPGLAFSMIYGALFTKTNRIARILAASKKIITKRRRFLSTMAQVAITCILIGIEFVITVIFLIVEPPRADFDHTIPRRVLLICQSSKMGFLAPFAFDLFLVAMCTLYAVKTRNLPENFNEAKFIGFTMYTTCIVWLAFIAIYFGSNKKDMTMSICFSLSASVALILLFFPKLYVILIHPEKNARSYFKTTTIRCHFGSNQKSSSDGNDSRLSSFSGSRRKTRPSSIKIKAKPGGLLANADSFSSYSNQSSPASSRAGSHRETVEVPKPDVLDQGSRRQSNESGSEGRSSIIDELANVKGKMSSLTTIQEIPSPSTSPVSMRRSRSLWRKFDPLLRNPELSQRWRSFRYRPETIKGKATPTLLLRIAAERLDTVRQILDEDKEGASDQPVPPASDEEAPSTRKAKPLKKARGRVRFENDVCSSGEESSVQEELNATSPDQSDRKLVSCIRSTAGSPPGPATSVDAGVQTNAQSPHTMAMSNGMIMDSVNAPEMILWQQWRSQLRSHSDTSVALVGPNGKTLGDESLLPQLYQVEYCPNKRNLSLLRRFYEDHTHRLPRYKVAGRSVVPKVTSCERIECDNRLPGGHQVNGAPIVPSTPVISADSISGQPTNTVKAFKFSSVSIV